MKSDNSRRARNARAAIKFVSASVAALSLAALAPVAKERLETQRVNAEWNDRAAEFVAMFSMDDAAARENGFRLTETRREERIWRMASAYASNRPLDAIAHDRDAIGAYQTFAKAHFDQAARQAKERNCLAQAIYYEARGETRVGRMAVAEVVLNRTRHHMYPNTICGVVYQGAERRTGCQFSFTCTGATARKPGGPVWDEANKLAAHVMLGAEEAATGGATHYHTVAVNPRWSGSLVHTRTIGSHIFYRFPGAAGRLPETEA